MTFSTSTPASPTSPTRKRRSLRIPSFESSHEFFSPSPYTSGNTDTSFHSRKSSQSSFQQYSPVTPRAPSTRSKRPSSSRLSIGSNISTGLASHAGFGNLADELEEAWDPDLDEPDSAFLEELQEGDPDQVLYSPDGMYGSQEFSKVMTPRSPRRSRELLEPPEKPPSPSKQWASMGTHLKTESLYDGSDYGPSSDDEAFDKIAPSLQRKMHDLEEVTRITSHADALSESGGVISRTTSALRDNLGTQAIVENTISRLSTAYNSLATHRTHQTREIIISSYPVLNSGAFSAIFDLPPEMIELIIAEIESLTETLSFLPTSPTTPASTSPLMALQSFAHNSHDFLATLHALTDTLIEHRQHLLMATRRLKTVRELVDELRMEEDLVETSMLLIQAGDWDRRCRERHAGRAAKDILEGFKNTWGIGHADDSWRPDLKTSQEVPVQ